VAAQKHLQQGCCRILRTSWRCVRQDPTAQVGRRRVSRLWCGHRHRWRLGFAPDWHDLGRYGVIATAQHERDHTLVAVLASVVMAALVQRSARSHRLHYQNLHQHDDGREYPDAFDSAGVGHRKDQAGEPAGLPAGVATIKPLQLDASHNRKKGSYRSLVRDFLPDDFYLVRMTEHDGGSVSGGCMAGGWSAWC
jgi:hypothetical protein